MRETLVVPEYHPSSEYKVLKSVRGEFSKPEKMRQAVTEEAEFGWDLMEKVDQHRLRFRRPVSERVRDVAAEREGKDPYRTTFGISEGRFVAYLLTVVVIFMVVSLVLAALLEPKG